MSTMKAINQLVARVVTTTVVATGGTSWLLVKAGDNSEASHHVKDEGNQPASSESGDNDSSGDWWDFLAFSKDGGQL